MPWPSVFQAACSWRVNSALWRLKHVEFMLAYSAWLAARAWNRNGIIRSNSRTPGYIKWLESEFSNVGQTDVESVCRAAIQKVNRHFWLF